MFFFVAFAIASPLWYPLLVGAARSSNLFGLALIGITTIATLIVLVAASAGAAIRWIGAPQWTPAIAVMAAIVVLVASGAMKSTEAAAQYSSVSQSLQRLNAYEQAYAAGPPFRGFTCNGPDLTPLTEIHWQANHNLGGTERNQGSYAGYWICAPLRSCCAAVFYTVPAMTAVGAARTTT